MKVRLQDLESLLDVESQGVRIVGIWGIGGSGKTTLATSLYMKISYHFQGHCIVGNVREKSKHGLEMLQGSILSAVCKKEVWVQTVEEGKHMIKSRLCRRKVLLLLDDVDTLNQLEALAGDHNWFGNGSRILITTRDIHLLRTHEVDSVLPSMLLSNGESFKLFNRHAFKKNMVKDYETLSARVIHYAAGLPLALKVLGSFLYGKSHNEWISALKKLEKIPDPNIINILKISYEGLEAYQKELLLEIACFWRHKEANKAKKMFEVFGYYPDIGLNVLREKALITIEFDGNIDMHDMVQEMGYEIVREKHPNNPEKHSRIWKVEDIKKLFLGDATMENNTIEVINCEDKLMFHASRYQNDMSHLCSIISKIKNLRWLRLNTIGADESYGAFCCDGPIFLSNRLRYIDWSGYPLSILFADTFEPMNLVVLKLNNTDYLEELWKSCKHLPHLKEFHLAHLRKLVKIPEFGGAVSLQKLIIHDCPKLEEIHPSLGNCTALEYVYITRCDRLKMFPTFVRMKNLKRLWISQFYDGKCTNTGVVAMSKEDGTQTLQASFSHQK